MLRKKILGILFMITLLLTACGNYSRNETSMSNDEPSNIEAVANDKNAEVNKGTTQQAKEKTTESSTSTEEKKTEVEITVENNIETETVVETTDEEATNEETTDEESQTDDLDSNKEEVTGDDTMIPILIQIGDKSFTANLYKNSTTDKFIEQLPLTVDMSELNGNEKYNYLPTKFPTNAESIGSIRTGDLMLYGSNCLVLFYKDFESSYRYKKMGCSDDTTGLALALGHDDIQVSFMIYE